MKLFKGPVTRSIRLLSSAGACVFVSLAAQGADYPTTVLGDHPTAYYRLEELPGDVTAVDSSGNSLDATYHISTSGSPAQGLPGIDTNSISFNGGGADYGFVDIPASSLITPSQDGVHGDPFSCELWVQPTTQPSDWSVPLEMAQYPKGWNFYVSGSAEGATSYFYLNMVGGALFQGVPDFPVQFLHWYHLAVTFDGTNAMIYVNAVPHGPYAAPNYAPAVGSDAHIGSGQGVGWKPFIGGVDEVAFYTNVLSSSQILAHYTVGTNSFRAQPTPPSILSGPDSVTNYSGLPVSFTVGANGTLPLHYRWLRNSTPTGPDSATYTFTCQYPADDGASLQVIVTNAYGSATSSVATLSVQTNVNIVGAPGSIIRNVGSYAAFHVIANGAVPITYQWSKSTDGVNFTPIQGGTNATLWLSSVQLADNGNTYQVHVSNPFDSATASATLSVQARAVNVPITKYAKVVVADSPVAYWRLDETSGSANAIDAVGSFDGTFTDTSGGAGVYGYQVPTGIPHETDPGLFVTNGATVTVPFAPELNPDGPWSVEGWYQPNSLDDYRVVLSSQYNVYPNPYNGWYIYQQPNATFAFVPQPGNGFIVAGPDDPAHGNQIVPGNWYHLVVTDDAVNFHVYINGEARASFPVSGIPFIPNGTGINLDGSPGITTGYGATVLGRRDDNQFGGFSGTMDDVAFYNKALTLQQVQNHYAATVRLTIVKSGNNVILSWPFGTLQSATTLNGTYTDMPAAVSPYSEAIGSGPKYYRVKAYTSP